MGTRADFYIGSGKDAEWLGSVAFDGYEWDDNADCALMTATTPDEFPAWCTWVIFRSMSSTTDGRV